MEVVLVAVGAIGTLNCSSIGMTKVVSSPRRFASMTTLCIS